MSPSRRRSVLVAVSVVLTTAVPAGGVTAQRTPDPRTASERLARVLSWDVPEGCPGRESVLARVDALVPDDAAPRMPEGDEADLRPTGAIRRREPAPADEGADGFRLELRAAPGRTPRVVTARACSDLVDAAAVILALLAFELEPGELVVHGEGRAPGEMATDAAGAAEGERPDAGEEDARASRAVDDPARSQDADSPETPQRPGTATKAVREDGVSKATGEVVRPEERALRQLVLGGAGALDAGPLPRATVGPLVAFELGLRLPRVDLDLRIDLRFLPSRTASAERPAAGPVRGDFRMLGGGLVGCLPAIRGGPVVLAPCAWIDVGVLFGEGRGLSDPGRGSDLWLALGGGAAARWWILPRFGLRLEGLLAAVPGRPDFVVDLPDDPRTRVHRSSRLAGRLVVGVEVALTGPATPARTVVQ